MTTAPRLDCSDCDGWGTNPAYCSDCDSGQGCRGHHSSITCDACKGEGSFPTCVKCGKRNYDPKGNPLLCEDCGAEDATIPGDSRVGDPATGTDKPDDSSS